MSITNLQPGQTVVLLATSRAVLLNPDGDWSDATIPEQTATLRRVVGGFPELGIEPTQKLFVFGLSCGSHVLLNSDQVRHLVRPTNT